jgi:hypothetical protein
LIAELPHHRSTCFCNVGIIFDPQDLSIGPGLCFGFKDNGTGDHSAAKGHHGTPEGRIGAIKASFDFGRVGNRDISDQVGDRLCQAGLSNSRNVRQARFE